MNKIGRYSIGLTGNIASGKSAVRQYLENMGAITRDADLLAQYTYLPSGPAYQPILDAFEEVARQTPRHAPIPRKILGSIVFSDPKELERLENIIYPILNKEIKDMLATFRQGLFVLEGINLIEAGFRSCLDSLWVAATDDAIREKRLIENRWMDQSEARKRINAQSPQELKIKAAKVVIRTDTSFQETWEQVHRNAAELSAALPKQSWRENDMELRYLQPERFDQANEILAEADMETGDKETWFKRMSAGSYVLAEKNDFSLLCSYKLDSGFAVLLKLWPNRPTAENYTAFLSCLTARLSEQLIHTLLIPQALISPKLAKQSGFLPGETKVKDVQPEIIDYVLRKFGLMAQECFLKPLSVNKK